MFKKILFASIGALLVSGAAHAAWPSSPVTIVVPFAAGQTGDIIARLISKELGATLGQPFVIDNRPGNGGQIGTAYAAKAKPDGYTLLLTSSGPFAIAPALYPKTTQYNAVKDFIGIAEAASTPQVIAVSNKSGIATFAELVKEAKTKDLSYGSAGNGSTQHLTMEMLKKELGFPLVHVPFKGSAESKIQVISGLIEATSDSLPAIYGNIRSKQMKPLVVVDTKRSAYLPDVPTIAEAGFPDMTTLAFFGLVAPKDTPKEVVDLLNKQITQMFRTPSFQEKMKEQALTLPVERTPEQFTAYLSSEVARWKQIVDKANVQVEKY
jgi:tripartite-type tricarboxylate transporter receptor subunit TctC